MPLDDAKPPRHGRPPYQPSAGERQWVTVATAGGMSISAIAAKLGMKRATLRRAFRAELDTGLATCEVQVGANILRIATGDSKSAAWAAVQWLRMRAPERWHDPPTQIANAPGEQFGIQVITGVPRAIDTGETEGQQD